jgi:hypothetical protein
MRSLSFPLEETWLGERRRGKLSVEELLREAFDAVVVVADAAAVDPPDDESVAMGIRGSIDRDGNEGDGDKCEAFDCEDGSRGRGGE